MNEFTWSAMIFRNLTDVRDYFMWIIDPKVFHKNIADMTISRHKFIYKQLNIQVTGFCRNRRIGERSMLFLIYIYSNTEKEGLIV